MLMLIFQRIRYVIYFTNAVVEIYIIKVILKLGTFFVQIYCTTPLLEVKWDVAK